MHTYIIYDRETGDVLHTVLSPGPIELSEEIITELGESGRLARTAFTEVHPSHLPLPVVLGDLAILRKARPVAGPDPSRPAPAPVRFAV